MKKTYTKNTYSLLFIAERLEAEKWKNDISMYYPSGVFGDVIQPFIQNRVVVTGTKIATFTCSSTQPPDFFDWSMWPVGSNHIIQGGGMFQEPRNFDWRIDGQESSLIVKNPSVSTAGVYTCEENDRHSAQLIVISKFLNSCE